ncbi:MAG: hypothetical protein L3J03_11955, partial [Desulfobacterales bacterium]|nr:hypothetical protein [Desulfobacterales bacterium]
SPLRRSEFLLDSLFMNSRPFSMERPLVEENPFPDRRGFTECLLRKYTPREQLSRGRSFCVTVHQGLQIYGNHRPVSVYQCHGFVQAGRRIHSMSM